MAENVEGAIQQLTRGLQAALGDSLVSLMLYGSEARHARTRHSDINVLLVMKDTSAQTLAQAAPALNAWVKVARAAPLIQSEDDWRASADVFPMEIEDIRDASRLLAGRDVISGLTTTREHLRHELEREARGKLIRLRAEYAASALDGQRLAEMVAGSLSTLVALFRAALRLAGKPVPAETQQVIEHAATLAGFAFAPFGWALAARDQRAVPALQKHDPIAAGYLEAVELFVEWINSVR